MFAMFVHDRMFRIAALLAALVLLLTASAGVAEAASPDLPQKKLTVMVYAIGTDLESRPDAAVSSDYLIRMMHSGFDREQINVVLLTGGCKYWKTGFPTDVNTIQVIEGDVRPTEVFRTESLMNMGEGSTLSYLLNYGVEHYPAENYALIVEDHGGGPLSGVCFDEVFDHDSITLPELSAALRNSPFGENKKLSWIYYCTCLTGSAEVAAVCAPYADYMFASEEPALSFAFRFSFLNGAETRSAEENGRMAADTFFAAAQEITTDHPNTYAVYDLRQMDRLADAMETLFAAADRRLGDLESLGQILAAVTTTQRVNPEEGINEQDLIDLRDLAQRYAYLLPEESEAVTDALDHVIVCNRSNVPREYGMLIYHPIRNKLFYQRGFRDAYRELCPFPAYLTYTEHFGDILTGDALAKYPSVQGSSGRPADGNVTSGTVLNADQQKYLREAELLILEDTGTNGLYRLISRTEAVPDETGALLPEGPREALYVVGGEGKALTDALEYTLADGQILLRGVMEIDPSSRALDLADVNALELDEDSQWTVNVLLRCRRQEDGSVKILSISPVHGGYADGRIIDPAEYDTLYLVSTPRQITFGEDGAVLPWDEWEDGGIQSYRYAVDLSGEWSLAFRDDQTVWAGRSAMMVVTDMQSSSHAVEWTALENPANESLGIAPQALYDDGRITVAAEDAWLNRAEDGDSLFIRLSLANNTDAPVTFTASGYVQDGTALDKDAELLGTVYPGQKGSAVCLIRAGEAAAPLAEASRISLTLATEAETGFGLWEQVEISLR